MKNLCLLSWLGLFLAGLSINALAASPPNILLIISDDHAWNDYSFMGHPHVRTPSLDKLAAESLAFTRGYVPSSLCSPSLISMITGLYPRHHGVTSNDPPMPKGKSGRAAHLDPLFSQGRDQFIRHLDSVSTLPRWLAQKDYLSFQTGKWWLGHHSNGGFTHGMTHGDVSRGGRHGDAGLAIGRQGLQPIYDFIQTAQTEQKPFFIWYAPFLPHSPHNPPERLLDKYRDKAGSIQIAKYWAMIDWFDETCGALLDHLQRQGLAENTIVVYVADNGWIQHPDADRFGPRSKQSPYDGGLRTPLLVRWPGHTPAKTIDTPVSSIDIAPTLLAAASIAPNSPLPGVNLLDPKAVIERKAIFGEIFTHDAVDLDRPLASLRFRWAISDGWKLIAPVPRNEPEAPLELFHIAADPFEQADLASAEPGRVRVLQALLDAELPDK